MPLGPLRGFRTEARHPKTLRAGISGRVFVALLGFGVGWALMSSSGESVTLGVLDMQRFQPFAIISKEAVSTTSSIYTVRPSLSTPPTSDPYTPSWAQGLWSVEFKQPQLQISRAYTPLPPTESTVLGDLRFLIRKEYKGEVSGYVDNLPIGGTIGIRGPKVEYEIPENVNEVVFLAGGTGIAPALQVAHTLLRRAPVGSQSPRVHILWANRRREDCEGSKLTPKSSWWFGASKSPPIINQNVFTKELEELERMSGGRLIIDYLVDEEGSFIDSAKILKAVGGSNGDKEHARFLMISGPEGFIKHFAGPKVWQGGNEISGPILGLLGDLRLPGWTVVKL
jgi:cytochrome-b5 reductase